MSQSDYIKYKRTSNILKDNTLPPILNTSSYTDFKQYSLENTITTPTSKIFHKRLIPTGKVRVFNMDKSVSQCPSFAICKDTHLRTNRIPLSTVYFTPVNHPTYVKHPTTEKTACNCKLNSRYTDGNICKCKTSF